MKLASIFLFGTALLATTVFGGSIAEETKTIDELYAEAVAEGGKLVLYHGGDTPTSQNTLRNAFLAAFPKMNFTAVVDYSKFHDVRVDNQLETDTLVPDVVALQTLQDFPRWEKEGKLLAYKPAGFSQIYDKLKSSTGAWLSHQIITFASYYDAAALAAAGLEAPKTPEDFADPQYAGHIASGYPHDDDAILFVYSRYVEKYGWDWVSKLATQSLLIERGSVSPGIAVAAKTKSIGVASSPSANSTRLAGNGTEYLSWGQRIGIMKKAPHPAAAKLFINWLFSKETQTQLYASRSTRTDIANADGTKKAWEIPEANTNNFATFMADREKVEQWKATFALYLGEVTGDATPGWLGLHPGA